MEFLITWVILCCFFALSFWFSCTSTSSSQVKNRPMPVPFKPEDPLPACDSEGNCVACGYPSGGHAWACISYYMNEVQKSYSRQLETVKRILEDISMGKPVQKLRCSLVLEEIRNINNLINTIGK